MEEAKFKEVFAVTFLATWCAAQYDNACATGQQKRLEKPPVEDALYLASKSWIEIQNVTHNA